MSDPNDLSDAAADSDPLAAPAVNPANPTAGKPNPASQRKTARANVVWRGGILVGPGKVIMIKVHNISEGGVGILSPDNIPVGHVFNLAIEIPALDNTPTRTQSISKVSAVHTVLSHDGYRVGVKFLEINPDHKNMIKTWVSKMVMPDR